MAHPPNILFLMTDQMQARVLEPGHPCRTPNFDRLIARGVRFARAYTPNAVCSPARASLMTGLLPHSHGVLQVVHCVDEDQCVLRPDKPHWAQRLAAAGYQTSYFGKWHAERSEQLEQFGWQTYAHEHSQVYRDAQAARFKSRGLVLQHTIDSPEGYAPFVLYGVTEAPVEERFAGVTTNLALEHLRKIAGGAQPWCCFVSVTEPHDPFICGREAYEQYDLDALELPANFDDALAGRPGLYRKAALPFADMTDQQKRQAMACYYGMISETDQQFGRLLEFLEESGQMDNTLVVLTTDHGECLGAHGLYMKNIGAFEEIYNIPLVVAGPGVAQGQTSEARVGLHDLCPTLCELAGAEPIDNGESRSFTAALRDPCGAARDFTTGYAEYFGTRYWLTQRIIWDGRWKLVWNGFDFDELYNLDDDPQELHNLAEDRQHLPQVRRLMQQAYRIIKQSNDHALLRSGYPVLRLAPLGPGIAE